MPAESGRHKARPKKYTLVIIPSDEAGIQRKFTLGVSSILLVSAGILLLASVIVLGLWGFTPIGVYLPIPNPELENRYHKQIVAIQERLTELTEDLVFLREYNVRLRKALGEPLSDEDSVLAASPLVSRYDQRSPSNPQDNMRSGRYGTMSEVQLATSYVARAVQIELPLTLPVQGYVTQEFKTDQQHLGIDFAGKVGSSIYAASDGVVIFSGWTYDDGYTIILAHGNGYRTTYKHNQALLKATGEYVRRSEPIALLGNTGQTSYGPHLHFEVWKDGTPRDPREYLLTIQ